MKAAFPVWKGMISPVFDVARQIRIVERSGENIDKETIFVLSTNVPMERVSLLLNNDVEELICGAISRPLYTALTHTGIQVIPFVAGFYREVLQAWLTGRLLPSRFTMPGCRRMETMGVMAMSENQKQGQQGRGSGGGMGAGRQWRRRGEGAGPGGFCVCGNCGHKQPHRRGVPCAQEKCPKCGSPMVRE